MPAQNVVPLAGNDDNELRLIEVDNMPVFYADGAVSAERVGANLRVTFFDVRTWCGELVRYPVLVLVCPADALTPMTVATLINKGRLSNRIEGTAH